MSKISEEFSKSIASNDKDNFNVLLVINREINPTLLGIEKYTVLMENLLAAELNSKEIQRLENDDNVLSIEPDIEIGTA